MSERDIFIAALQKEDPAQRQAYLDEACARQPELRQQVEHLLRLHEGAGSFLEKPAAEAAATGAFQVDAEQASSPEASGTVIGPYKLIQQIGEGGMGTVWMAQQTVPVKRLVAVKLIKAGMDSRQVIARFEAERQALALMDHPNIARVLDGGTTKGEPGGVSPGRPYFVMDLVKGVPITRYCDEHHLTPRQRLELFVPVCSAVQHAHQKGIIHRDLKPSNVLVAPDDGKPVPKVIDFGVAKAAGQPLTDKTLVTGFGNIVGTLEYMSPEQAELNNHDIDTRSDIYSLGVLLYELLTGSPPFSRKDLEKAGMLEMLRVIREQEPSKPSTKLSTAEGLPTLAANRGTEPAKLTRLVCGELDWIVMKALEKDRNRRYETANGFAMDVQRYLADEAVQACPPSAGYRLRKFARRNKGGLAVAALVLFFLVLLGSGAGWALRDRSAREAEAARQQGERQAKVAGQVESSFAEVDRLEKEQKWPEALAAARRAEAAVAVGEANAETTERVRQRLKGLELIDRLEQVRVEDHNRADKLDRGFAQAFRDYGVDVEELAVEASVERLKVRPVLAIPLGAALDEWVFARRRTSNGNDAGCKRLVAIANGLDPEPLRSRLRSTPYPPTPEAADELRRLADSINVREHHPATLLILARTLQGDSALRILREAQFVYPGDFWLKIELANQLGYGKKDFDGAIRFYTAALAVRPSAMSVYSRLGDTLRTQGKPDEAIAIYRKAIEINPKHPSAPYWLLGNTLHSQGKLDEAIAVYRKILEVWPEDPGGPLQSIGDTLRDKGKPHEAIDFYRQAIEASARRADTCLHSIGDILRDQKKPAEAADAYREAIKLKPNVPGHHHSLGLALRDQNKLAEANAAFDRAIELNRKAAYLTPAGRYHSIGVGLRDKGELDEAIAAFRKALDIDPKYVSATEDLLKVLRARGKVDEVSDVYRNAIAADPYNAGAYSGLGDALQAQGRRDEAIEVYRQAIKADPKAFGVYFTLGQALVQQKKLLEAMAAFYKAIDIAPTPRVAAGAYDTLGSSLYVHKMLPEAIDAYRKAIELDPIYHAAGSYINLGLILREQNKLDEAIDAFRKAIEVNQPYATAAAHVQLGDVLVQQNKLDEAIAVYHKVIDLEPNSPNTHNKLAWILATRPEATLRDPKQAVALAKRAVELKPGEGSYRTTLGAAHYRAGDWKEAIAALEKSMAMRKGGDSKEWFFLAMTHWRLGDKDKAREWYDRAVQWMDKNQPKNEELRRFRAEAAELLELNEKK